MFMGTRSLVALLQLQLIWVESGLIWSNFRPRIIYQFGVFAKRNEKGAGFVWYITKPAPKILLHYKACN